MIAPLEKQAGACDSGPATPRSIRYALSPTLDLKRMVA